MRTTLCGVAVAIWAVCGSVSEGAAQPAPGPAIQHVTLHEGTGVLTIGGIGFGREPVVTIDGYAVSVLPGGSDTAVAVEAPAVLRLVPGTYRLTVEDPARQAADTFVVASPAWRGAFGAADPDGPPASQPSAAPTAATPTALSAPATAAGSGAPGWLAPLTVEDSVAPYRTAIGYSALANNSSTGTHNTAAGYQTLLSNTTGDYNAASGALALRLNTTGSGNTASGLYALGANTTGWYNTASGYFSLRVNTTGANNTAAGTWALYAATGSSNTALGYWAGGNATTGNDNLFLGAEVRGTAADTNTIRIGRAYDGGAGTGQNQAFVAGIYGTQLTGVAQPVFVDANGQLGTITAAVGGGDVGTSPGPSLTQQVRDQEATIAELRATDTELRMLVADLRARLARVERRAGTTAGR